MNALMRQLPQAQWPIDKSRREHGYFQTAKATATQSFDIYVMAVATQSNGLIYRSNELGLSFSIPSPVLPLAHLVW